MVNYNEYYKSYILCRSLVNDELVLPQLDFDGFKKYVSRENWVPIPLKDELVDKKQDITNSKRPHICFVLKSGTISFDIFYNGTQSVKNFMNILEGESFSEKQEFIEALKQLDSRFSYHLLYCEKFYSATPDWQLEIEGKCDNLTDQNIEELLKKIKETLQKRDFRQSMLPDSHIATLGMGIADITVNINNKEDIKYALQKVIGVFRICTKIKSTSQINKIRREQEKQIKVKKCPYCDKIFEHNTMRTICPKCVVDIENSTIKKKAYDLLKAEGKILT